MDKKVKVNANTLVGMLDTEALAMIAKKTRIDNHARKLQGLALLKLMLQGLLVFASRLTLSGVMEYYRSNEFIDRVKLVEDDDPSISKAAISKRLKNINPEYFKEIYDDAADKWGDILSKAVKPVIPGLELQIVDSSLVTQSAKILKRGITYGRSNGKGEKREGVKYTLGFNGAEALYAAVHLDPEYADEDNALGEAILDMTQMNRTTKDKAICVFDRGIKSGVILEEMDQEKIRFVGRMNNHRTLYHVRPSSAPAGELPSGTLLLKDEIVNINGKNGKKIEDHEFRVISVELDHEIGKRKEKGNRGVETTLTLITNELELSVAEILEIYKFRWKIEVFFKFLKQYLDMSHLISGSENGLTVMLYITLIGAALLKAYCILNGKSPKFMGVIIAGELQRGIEEYLEERWLSQLDPTKYVKNEPRPK